MGQNYKKTAKERIKMPKNRHLRAKISQNATCRAEKRE
jgi:hypothetical protein